MSSPPSMSISVGPDGILPSGANATDPLLAVRIRKTRSCSGDTFLCQMRCSLVVTGGISRKCHLETGSKDFEDLQSRYACARRIDGSSAVHRYGHQYLLSQLA